MVSTHSLLKHTPAVLALLGTGYYFRSRGRYYIRFIIIVTPRVIDTC